LPAGLIDEFVDPGFELIDRLSRCAHPPELVLIALNASPCLKMSIRNGLSKPSDTTPKMADRMLNPK
jgi:hypothetical protein